MNELWDIIKTECCNYWKTDQDEKIGFDNFCKRFGHIEYDELKEAIDYVASKLIRSTHEWPATSLILNVLRTNRELKGSFKDLPEVNETPKFKKARYEFYKAFDDLDKKIENKEIHIGFENNIESPRDTNINSLGECLALMFKQNWEKPAIHDFMKKRKKEPRIDRSLDDIIEQNGEQLCYYCFGKILKQYETNDNPNRATGVDLVFKDEYKCHKCGVTYA